MRRLLLATTAISALALGTPPILAQTNAPTQDEQRQQQQKGAKPMTQAPAQKAPGKSAEMPNRSTRETQSQAPSGKEPRQQTQGETQGPRNQQHLQGQSQTQHLQGQAQSQGSHEQHPQGQAQSQGSHEQQHPQGQAQAPRNQQHLQGQAQGPREQQARTPNGRGQVQVTEQQRTEIHQRFAHFRGERIEHPNFSVSVGAEIPRSVHVERLPPEIVEIVPEYRGYDYVMVGDEILIIDPESLEIVAVFPA